MKLLANFGVGGYISSQILDEVTQVLALDPKPEWCIIGEIAANGALNASETHTQIIDNLKEMIRLLTSNGINVVVQTSPPSSLFNTSAKAEINERVNDYIRRLAGRDPSILTPHFGRVVVADVAAVLTNPTTGNDKANVTMDGIHWSNLGGQLAGTELAKAMAPYIGGSIDLAPSNVDFNSATPNPMMVGTGGFKATGMTGSVADNFNAVWSGTAGTADLSKIASDDDFDGGWQRINLQTAGTLWLQQYPVLVPTTNYVVGDKFVFELEYRTQSWANITKFYAEIFAAGGYSVADMISLYTQQMRTPGVGYKGVLRTPVFTFPGPTAPSYVAGQFCLGGVSGTVDVRRMRMRKVL